MASSAVARLIGALAPVALIPVALPYVGSERYGVWMTVVSLSAMLVWADLGLGNGLMTRLSPMVASENWNTARETVGAAYLLVASVAVCLTLASVATYWLVPWGQVLNAAPDASPNAIAAACLVAFSANIVASLVHRVCYAMDHVAASNVVLAISSLLSLAIAAAGVLLRVAPDVLVGAVLAAPAATNVIFTFLYFARHREVRPQKGPGIAASRRLLTLSAGFFVLSIMTTMAINLDNLIVARVTDSEAVTTYSVTQRLFVVLILLANVVNLPLWPANARAIEQGDVAWIVSTTRRASLLGGAAALGLGTVIWLLGPFITRLLSGGLVSFDPVLGAGFVAWTSLSALSSPLFMVQNAVGRVGWQLLGWGTYLVLSIPLKAGVATATGVAWVPWAGAGLYLTVVIPGCWRGYHAAMATVSRATT
jgi:O-antigen/teichoic acid export membrane protein